MKTEIEFLKEIKEEIRTANNINCSSYSMENNPTYMNYNNLTAIQSKIHQRIEKLESKAVIIEMMNDAKKMGLYEDNKVEELLVWISQFCGNKGFIHTDNGTELKWYLKEEAEKLYEGVDDKKLPLYTTKEIMVKYYSYTT